MMKLSLSLGRWFAGWLVSLPFEILGPRDLSIFVTFCHHGTCLSLCANFSTTEQIKHKNAKKWYCTVSLKYDATYTERVLFVYADTMAIQVCPNKLWVNKNNSNKKNGYYIR